MGSPTSVVGVSSLGTGSTQVIAADTTRKWIEFHNPNTTTQEEVAICPAFDNSGSALTAGFGTAGANAGNYVLEPGGIKRFEGNVQSAWLAAAKANANNTLTIWTQSS